MPKCAKCNKDFVEWAEHETRKAENVCPECTKKEEENRPTRAPESRPLVPEYRDES